MVVTRMMSEQFSASALLSIDGSSSITANLVIPAAQAVELRYVDSNEYLLALAQHLAGVTFQKGSMKCNRVPSIRGICYGTLSTLPSVHKQTGVTHEVQHPFACFAVTILILKTKFFT